MGFACTACSRSWRKSNGLQIHYSKHPKCHLKSCKLLRERAARDKSRQEDSTLPHSASSQSQPLHATHPKPVSQQPKSRLSEHVSACQSHPFPTASTHTIFPLPRTQDPGPSWDFCTVSSPAGPSTVPKQSKPTWRSQRSQLHSLRFSRPENLSLAATRLFSAIGCRRSSKESCHAIHFETWKRWVLGCGASSRI